MQPIKVYLTYDRAIFNFLKCSFAEIHLSSKQTKQTFVTHSASVIDDTVESVSVSRPDSLPLTEKSKQKN